MSNLSPFTSSQTNPRGPPSGPSILFESEPEHLHPEDIHERGDPEHEHGPALSTSPESTPHESLTPDDSVTDETKMKAIVEEFGDIAHLMEPPAGELHREPEKILAESIGSLFK